MVSWLGKSPLFPHSQTFSCAFSEFMDMLLGHAPRRPGFALNAQILAFVGVLASSVLARLPFA
jgi:hypothetical protein